MFREKNKTKDWKEYLDDATKQTLMEIIQKTQQYVPAITMADDSAIAQLWVAIAILKREFEDKFKLLEMATEPWKAIVDIGNMEKRRAIEKILIDIVQPKDKEQKEIIDKLVDSLMKF